MSSIDDHTRILHQLSEMFRGITHRRLEGVCEKNNWNLNACIDELVEDGIEDPEEDTTDFSGALCSRGAVPKVTSPQYGDNFYNTSYNGNNRKEKNVNILVSPQELKIGEQIKAGYRVMIIMRGAPGSGKTYLAHSLVRSNGLLNGTYHVNDFVLSTDDYFFDAAGHYKYNVNLLSDAHDYNHKRVREKAREGWSPIIVDNTNMKLWEMLPYVQAAVQNGYLIELLEPATPWKRSARQLAAMNRHGVPYIKIGRMLENYEEGSVKDLLKMLKNTKYTVQLPQMRIHPPLIIAPQYETDTGESFNMFFNEKRPQCIPSPQFSNNQKFPFQESYKPKEQRSKGVVVAQHFKDNANKAEECMKTDEKISKIKDMKIEATEAAPFYTEPIKQREDKNDYKTLLDLLREDINVACAEEKINQSDSATTILQRHNIGCPNEDVSFISLRQIYPNKPVSGLWDLFVKCNGSLDWAVDILLKEGELSCTREDKCNNDFYIPNNTTPDTFTCSCQFPEPLLSYPDVKSPPALHKPLPQRQRVRSSRTQQYSNGELSELKDSIEKCFQLGDDQYSEHVLKIRNMRNARAAAENNADLITGYQMDDFRMNDPNIEDKVELKNDTVDNNFENKVEATTNVATIHQDLHEYEHSTLIPITNNFTPIDDNDDNDDDDDDDEDNNEQETELMEDDDEDTDYSDGEETLELSLSKKSVQQLFNHFRDESPSLLQHMKIKLPSNLLVLMSRSLAKRLYMLCMESLYSMVEEERQTMIRSDEEFARLLKSPKYAECKHLPDNVQELLDMEMALNMYNEEKEKLKEAENSKVKDLATYLTEMKLCDTFPHIPRETLMDILTAHDNRYDDTVTTLNRMNLLPSKRVQPRTPSEMGLPSSHGRPHSSKTSLQDSLDIVDDTAKELALLKFEDMRNQAAHHHQLKAECYRKGQEAVLRKQGSIAMYYTQIAEMHKKKIDAYNQIAANCIREVHQYSQNNQDHLDLHYLYVPEALECLDLFLDRHITNLRINPDKHKDVYVITGRGRHSVSGVSTIKTKVIARLRERNLKYKKENAGLLKVKIFAASRHSKNFV